MEIGFPGEAVLWQVKGRGERRGEVGRVPVRGWFDLNHDN